MHRLILSAIAAILAVSASSAAEIRVLTWNVESDLNSRQTNDPVVIAQQLTELQTSHGPYDLIALPEHNPFTKRPLFSLFCKSLLPNDLGSSSSVRLARWREQPFAEKAVPVN